ncbi:protein kinase, partial [Myxococcota bacterium]
FGRLTLQSEPWAVVFFRGKRLGPTPLVETKLPAGKIRLRLVNSEVGIDQTVNVSIPAGGHLKKSVQLEED